MNQSPPVVLITEPGNGIGPRPWRRVLAQEGYAIAAIDVREDGLALPGRRIAKAQQKIKIALEASPNVTDPARPAASDARSRSEARPYDLVIRQTPASAPKTSGLQYDIAAMNRS